MFNITVPQMNMLLKYVEISLKNGPIGGKRTTRRGKKVSHRKKHTQRKQRK